MPELVGWEGDARADLLEHCFTTLTDHRLA
jgi:hypothetical protein